ncbi:hypothetical protein GLOIN_2v1467900, partial [Rhizophagus irregularis DAOM 181602=DAOM 197198]
ISLQSYNIFTSLAESLVLLIIAHRDYYSDYPLLPWEHGTEALEHVFGIVRQLVPDFTAYEFFKVMRKVMYHDKIIRNGEFKCDKDKLSASGYVIDIDTRSIDSNILEILRKWPSNSEIYDAIRIAYQNAYNFAKMVNLVSNELELTPIVFVNNNSLADDLIQDNNEN